MLPDRTHWEIGPGVPPAVPCPSGGHVWFDPVAGGCPCAPAADGSLVTVSPPFAQNRMTSKKAEF